MLTSSGNLLRLIFVDLPILLSLMSSDNASSTNKDACIFLDLLDKSDVSGWLKITEY
jgi:hypothetical protein